MGLGGLIFHQKSGECHAIQRKQIKINLLKLKCTNLTIIELAMYVCMYVSHVLNRKLLERLMSPSLKSQVMFAPHSH